MEEKEIFGIIINIIAWPLIIYFIFKSRLDSRKQRKEHEDFNRPENKFKRELARLELSLDPFTNRNYYPYILGPTLEQKQKAVPASFLKDGVNPHTFRQLKDIQMGRSERKLYAYLITQLGFGKVFLGSHSIYGYYPDILYVDDEKKIFIDIEIDEPYANKSNEPIHFLQLSYDTNGKPFVRDLNKERDDALVKYGWTVVRFSENHVLTSPKACCDIVKYVIDYWSLSASKDNMNTIKINHHRRWTQKEAVEMSINRSRQHNR
jgi:hypothetical protein